MKRRTLLAALPLLAAPANAAARLKAVATFSILADFLREVGGEDVEVASLVGPDADVHSFQPTPREARLLASASLLVSNGLGFEGWLDRLAERVQGGELLLEEDADACLRLASRIDQVEAKLESLSSAG